MTEMQQDALADTEQLVKRLLAESMERHAAGEGLVAVVEDLASPRRRGVSDAALLRVQAALSRWDERQASVGAAALAIVHHVLALAEDHDCPLCGLWLESNHERHDEWCPVGKFLQALALGSVDARAVDPAPTADSIRAAGEELARLVQEDVEACGNSPPPCSGCECCDPGREAVARWREATR